LFRFTLWRDIRGSTVAEFTFAFPVLILLILGVVEVGRALQAQGEASLALGKAIRVLYLDPTSAAADIEAELATSLAGIQTTGLTIATEQTQLSGNAFLKVSVSFPFQMLIPLEVMPTVTLRAVTFVPLISASS
ncbi:MAG: TadE/TadG family type IV pilus assembly protein, partial [Rhodospirillales bacterium]